MENKRKRLTAIVGSFAILCIAVFGVLLIDRLSGEAGGGGTTQLDAPTPTLVWHNGFYYLRWSEIDNAVGYQVRTYQRCNIRSCGIVREFVTLNHNIPVINTEADLENGRLFRGLTGDDGYLYFHATTLVFGAWVWCGGTSWHDIRFDVQAIPATGTNFVASNIGQVGYLPGVIPRQFIVNNVRLDPFSFNDNVIQEAGLLRWDHFDRHIEIYNVSSSAPWWHHFSIDVTIDGTTMGSWQHSTSIFHFENALNNLGYGWIDASRYKTYNVSIVIRVDWPGWTPSVPSSAQVTFYGRVNGGWGFELLITDNQLTWGPMHYAVGYRVYIQTGDDEWTSIGETDQRYFDLDIDTIRTNFGAGTHSFRIIGLSNPLHQYIRDSIPSNAVTFIIRTQVQLSTPTQVTVSGQTISWTTTNPSGTQYSITINGTTHEITGSSFVWPVAFNVGSSYNISIVALGSETATTIYQQSASVTHIHTPQTGGNGGNGFNFIPWLLGGIAILFALLFLILIIKQRNKMAQE